MFLQLGQPQESFKSPEIFALANCTGIILSVVGNDGINI